MEYLVHILVLVAVYSGTVYSLDLLVGHSGIMSLCHASFFGIGAYSSALLSIHYEPDFLLVLVAAGAASAAMSVPISVPITRLRGDFLVIATFAFQVVVYDVMNNWSEVTRGPLGLSGIPQPRVLGVTIATQTGMAGLALVLGVAACGLCLLVSTSPFGRSLRAVRDDRAFAQSVGKNPRWFEIRTFGLAAAIAGVMGAVYAHYSTYIDPTGFGTMESILMITMVILGCPGSKWGPAIGAIVLVTLPEVLRAVGLPPGIAATARQSLYGACLVLLMIARPKGFSRRVS